MATDFIDGFEAYGNSPDPNYSSRVGGAFKWVPNSGWTPSTPTRSGFGKMLNSAGAARLIGEYATARQEQWSGIAVLGSFSVEMRDYDADTVQMTIQCDGTIGRVRFWRGQTNSTLLAETASNIFSGAVWNYFEWYVFISDTVGAIEARINGQTVLTVSGIDNKVSSLAGFNEIQMAANNVDDFYTNNNVVGPGSYPNNGFMGDIRVDTLFPVGDASVAWTPLTGGSNFAMVDELACDGDTTYNYTTTVGATDYFTFGALSGVVNAVIALQVSGVFRKDDAGTRTFKMHTKSAAAVADGSVWSAANGYLYYYDIFAVDPNTSASWTPAAVNAIQAGITLES